MKRLLEDLGAEHIPMLTLYNKKDLLQTTFIPFERPALTISAFDEADHQRVLNETEHLVKSLFTLETLVLESDEGKKLQQLQTEGIVQTIDFNEETEQYRVMVYLPESHPLLSKSEEESEF